MNGKKLFLAVLGFLAISTIILMTTTAFSQVVYGFDVAPVAMKHSINFHDDALNFTFSRGQFNLTAWAMVDYKYIVKYTYTTKASWSDDIVLSGPVVIGGTTFGTKSQQQQQGGQQKPTVANIDLTVQGQRLEALMTTRYHVMPYLVMKNVIFTVSGTTASGKDIKQDNETHSKLVGGVGAMYWVQPNRFVTSDLRAAVGPDLTYIEANVRYFPRPNTQVALFSAWESTRFPNLKYNTSSLGLQVGYLF
jgi:hypothetical protein